MQLHFWDIVVLATYFAVILVAGFWFTRISARGLRSYFLGENKQKWWMLAASGSASNYSVDGTVWNISMLMVLGMLSWYSTLVWWMPCEIVLMAFMAIWIRRTGAVTAADLNTVRFGTDRGAQAARVGFAILISTFSVMTLCMSYVMLHEFAVTFGFHNGHLVAITLISSTGLYVICGGFRGVVITEFIQNILLISVSFVIGFICVMHYDADKLEKAISHQSLTVPNKLEELAKLKAKTISQADLAVIEAEKARLTEMLEINPALEDEKPEVVTFRDWNSLTYRTTPKLGRFNDSEYSDWKDFGGMALAMSIVGAIGSIGGAGGRYGEQRFLAARSAKHAAWQAALWQVMAIPRWVVTGGLAFLAYAMFKDGTIECCKVVGERILYSDPNAIYPLYVQSDLLAPGVRGLVIATLAASYMSAFSSEVNAAASIVVHDIFQPIFMKDDEKARGNMYASYIATAVIVCAALCCGYIFTEFSSLNGVWSWMLGGLITCVVVPLALRWYWGRMNGWGFAAGCVIGFVPSLMMLSKKFAGKDAWVQKIPDSYYTIAILVLSLIACIIVSLITKPVDSVHIDRFYRRVRPFGFWGSVSRRAMASSEPANAPLSLPFIPINIIVGVTASYALYMTPVYCMGRWFGNAAVSFGIFSTCAVTLYFTWFKTLPKD